MLFIALEQCTEANCVPRQGVCVLDACTCNAGFYGPNCSTDEIDCGKNNCNSNGECRAVPPNGYACVCAAGFYGLECQFDFQQCKDTLCNGKGNCTNESTCICDNNFDSSKGCAECLTDFLQVGDACYNKECVSEGAVCSENGECVNTTCRCSSGYYGEVCESTQEECDQNVCSSNGVCVTEGLVSKCECKIGYEGSNCSQCSADYVNVSGSCEPQNCVQDSKVCNNSGVCQRGDEYFCACNGGSFGERCTLTEQECNANFCTNHGVCTAKTQALETCDCDEGHAEPNCSTCLPSYEPVNGSCWPQDCVNKDQVCSLSGQCVSKRCVCTSGFFGEFCEINASICNNTVCNGHGRCVADTFPIQCACNLLFLLPFCENCSTGYVDLNGTCTPAMCVNASVICSNHGTCGADGCECSSGYYGRLCDQNEETCNTQRCNDHGSCAGAGCNCSFPWSGVACNECIGEAFQMLAGGCYSINCIADNIVCSGSGNCNNTGGFCECHAGFYGKLCDMGEEQCDRLICNSNGACSVETGAQCKCKDAYAAPLCSECRSEGGYVQGIEGGDKVCVHKTCLKESGERVCNGNGACVNNACKCRAEFIGELCEVNQTECDVRNCSGQGSCFVQAGQVLCNCSGGTVAEKCCPIGSIAGQCITPAVIGLITAIAAVLIIAVVGTVLIMEWRRRIEKSREQRQKAKFYTMQDLKLFNGGSNNFFI